MMTDERWRYTETYLHEVFGADDEHLRDLVADASAKGLPDIAVSPEVGVLLSLLVRGTRAERALEIGTLGGYSATWIARALAPGGRLYTLELDDRFADFAEAHFAAAKLAGVIEVRRGAALATLPGLARELGPSSLDFVFVDAEKTEYPEYWAHVRPLIRAGGIFVADNILGAGSWWIDDLDSPARAGADRLNRAVARDPDFEAAGVPLRQGLLVARRRR
jgi:predicted O-methyltransferase YrrM